MMALGRSVKLHLRRYINEERSGNNGLFEGMEAGQRARWTAVFILWMRWSMALSLVQPKFIVERDETRCIACQVCLRQCANDVHYYDETDARVLSDPIRCVGCHRCVTVCPTDALNIRQNPLEFRPHANWTGSMPPTSTSKPRPADAPPAWAATSLSAFIGITWCSTPRR
jgi:ferredoxin